MSQVPSHLDVEIVEQLDPRLGRQKVHDERSRSFPMGATIQRSSWVTKRVQIIDPTRNPNQCHGECTGCANAMMLNSVGNRESGRVLDMHYAHRVYSGATAIDPWPGSWPPTDTGSSGLAAAKVAQRLGTGGGYRHIFGGADEVIQTVQDGRVVSVGTWWYEGLMRPNRFGMVEPTGDRIGGHQYVVHGYIKESDLVLIRCWWGRYKDVTMRRQQFNDLLMAGGDAHVQDRVLGRY